MIPEPDFYDYDTFCEWVAENWAYMADNHNNPHGYVARGRLIMNWRTATHTFPFGAIPDGMDAYGHDVEVVINDTYEDGQTALQCDCPQRDAFSDLSEE